jgi:hypothetical protein
VDLLLTFCRVKRRQCVSDRTLLLTQFTFVNPFIFAALVHPENQLNTFLAYSGVDAWRVIEIQPSQNSSGHGEFLLVFQTLAIYVDLQGRKSRDREIMYPAVPTHISELSVDLSVTVN